MNTVKCLRCNHEWEPRVPDPRSCPNCHRYDWNRVASTPTHRHKPHYVDPLFDWWPKGVPFDITRGVMEQLRPDQVPESYRNELLKYRHQWSKQPPERLPEWYTWPDPPIA